MHPQAAVKYVSECVSSDCVWLHFAFPLNIQINASMTSARPAEYIILQWSWTQSTVTADKVPPFPSLVHPQQAGPLSQQQSCQKRFGPTVASFNLAFVTAAEEKNKVSSWGGYFCMWMPWFPGVWWHFYLSGQLWESAAGSPERHRIGCKPFYIRTIMRDYVLKGNSVYIHVCPKCHHLILLSYGTFVKMHIISVWILDLCLKMWGRSFKINLGAPKQKGAVQLLCKYQRNSLRATWRIAFMRMGWTWGHCDFDLWRP